MLQYTKSPIGVIVASAGASANVVTTATSALSTGQVAVYLEGVYVADTLDGAITADYKFIWKDKKGTTIVSDTVNYSGITYKDYIAYSAPAAQMSFIGFNGTSGAIEVYDNEEYVINILLKNSTIMGGHLHNVYPKWANYTSDSSATQAEIASGLVSNLYKNFKDEPVMRVQADCIANSTSGVATSGGVFSVVLGSNTVKVVESSGAAGDAGKYNTDSSTIAVGDFIRFTANTAVTPVYKVTAISGAGTATCYITLNRPYTYASNASLAAASTYVISASAAASLDFGIRLTSVELFATTTYCTTVTNYWTTPDRLKYDVNSFTIVLFNGFGSTPITYSTTASRGVGTYWEVTEHEYFNQGFSGNQPYTGYPSFISRANTTAGYTYDTWIIQWQDDGSTSESIGLTYKQPKTIFIYVNASDSTGVSDLNTGLATS